jgi:ferrous iron transport protein A
MSDLKTKNLQTLADLNGGETGIIASITGDTLNKQRLSSMGLVKGTEVKVEHTSLFGDPRTYIVKGYSICMRKLEAQQVKIL